jgi:phosphoribosyl-AMP cyclohydrolase
LFLCPANSAKVRKQEAPRQKEKAEEDAMQLDFTKSDGLIPVIIQDATSGEVLMLGFMNDVAFGETQRTGEVVFFSRSRNRLWKKGESSGHVLKVRDIRLDCDADSLLIRVDPVGPGVCHEGYRSCFFRSIASDGATQILEQRTFDPEKIYAQQTQPQQTKRTETKR